MDNQWNIDAHDEAIGQALHRQHPDAKEKVWKSIQEKTKPSVKSKRMLLWRWMPAGIAAAVLFIIGFMVNEKPNPEMVTLPSGNSIVQTSTKPTTADTSFASSTQMASTAIIKADREEIKASPAQLQKESTIVHTQDVHVRVPSELEADKETPIKTPDIHPQQKETEQMLATKHTTQNKKRSLHINDIPGMDVQQKNNPSALTKFIDEVQEPNKRNFASQFTLRKQH